MIRNTMLRTIYENTYYVFISSLELPVRELNSGSKLLKPFPILLKQSFNPNIKREPSLEILSLFTALGEAELKG